MCLHAHHSAGISTCQSQRVFVPGLQKKRKKKSSKQLPGMSDCMTADKRAINMSVLHANSHYSQALHYPFKWLIRDTRLIFFFSFLSMCLSVCLYCVLPLNHLVLGWSQDSLWRKKKRKRKREAFVNKHSAHKNGAVKRVADFCYVSFSHEIIFLLYFFVHHLEVIVIPHFRTLRPLYI